MDFAIVFSVLDSLYKEIPLEYASQFGEWLDMVERILRWSPTLWLYYNDKLDEDPGYANSSDKEALKRSMDMVINSIVHRTVGLDTLSDPSICDVRQGREKLYAVRDSFQNRGVIQQMRAYKVLDEFINNPNNSPIKKYKKIRTFPYMNLDDKGRIVLLLRALEAYPLFRDLVGHLDRTTELKYADLLSEVQCLSWSSPAMSTERNLQPKRIKKRKERPYCHFCHRIGHDDERCYKKHKRFRTDKQAKSAVKDLSELEYTLKSGHSNQYHERQAIDANEAEAEASGKILFKEGAKRFLVDGPISFLDPRLMN